MSEVVVEKVLLGGELVLALKKYILELRTAFGTSHSSTTKRTNALIRITWKNHVGHGEVGLPPKKKHCYLADFDDIRTFFTQYVENVEKELKKFENLQNGTTDTFFSTNDGIFYDPFKDIPNPYFATLRVELGQSITLTQAMPLLLFKVLDTYLITEPNTNTVPQYRNASVNGIEMAILDLCGVTYNKPLYDIIGCGAPIDKKSFYTSGLNDDISEMEKSTEFGLQYTDNIKIKVDQNVQKCVTIVQRLHDVYKKSRQFHSKWAIDANSAWTPDVALRFLRQVKELVPEFLPMLYMIEQPFPVELLLQTSPEDTLGQQWIEVKKEYERTNIYIFGDESVSTVEQVPKIMPYVHGVNIKLEKAGGIRGALKTILAAKERGLKVLLGSMVSTSLSCTAFAHLMALADIGDLDGGLLVDEKSQILQGGFKWDKNDANETGFISIPNLPGIGVK
jgi:L-alanine-DL-glutamate epimerase-like enolase superfamily enzyme